MIGCRCCNPQSTCTACCSDVGRYVQVVLEDMDSGDFTGGGFSDWWSHCEELNGTYCFEFVAADVTIVLGESIAFEGCCDYGTVPAKGFYGEFSGAVWHLFMYPQGEFCAWYLVLTSPDDSVILFTMRQF